MFARPCMSRSIAAYSHSSGRVRAQLLDYSGSTLRRGCGGGITPRNEAGDGMAEGKSTELTRYVTEGEVLYRAGDLRITITMSAACVEAAKRVHEQIAQLRQRLHGVASRRIVLPSDERATIIDQD